MSNAFDPTEYPEHLKMQGVTSQSQTIGEFLENSGYSLCVYNESTAEFHPVSKSVEQVLADYFGINLSTLEQEKRKMLEALANG